MGLNYYQIKKNVLKARKLVIRGTSVAGVGQQDIGWLPKSYQKAILPPDRILSRRPQTMKASYLARIIPLFLIRAYFHLVLFSSPFSKVFVHFAYYSLAILILSNDVGIKYSYLVLSILIIRQLF